MKKTLVITSTILFASLVGCVLDPKNPYAQKQYNPHDPLQCEYEQGEIGPQGDPGLIGPVGQQGSMGPEGSVGLQGSVGPQGSQGLTGQQGFTGPQGLIGPRGPSLKVVDNNGFEVGYVTLAVIGTLHIFDPNINKIIRYNYYTAKANVGETNILYYISTDCSGTPMVGGGDNPSPYVVLRFNGDNKIYSPNDYSDISSTPVAVNSSLENDLLCRNMSGQLQFPTKLYQIGLPTFTGPLRVIIQ